MKTDDGDDGKEVDEDGKKVKKSKKKDFVSIISDLDTVMAHLSAPALIIAMLLLLTALIKGPVLTYHKTPPSRRIYFGIHFFYKTSP